MPLESERGPDVSDREPRTIHEVLSGMVRQPYRQLLRPWNWKAAVTSAATRGAVFFLANLSGNPGAARAAFLTEFVLRGVTSGFYGTITQRFSLVEPRWVATVTASALMPLMSHAIELLVHWLRGTDRLAASMSASVIFTVISTAFSLHVMRNGVMTVGEGSQSLMADLRALPALVLPFLGIRQPRSAPAMEQAEFIDTAD